MRAALDNIACGEIEKMLCGICGLGSPPGLPLMGKGLAGALFFVLGKIRGSSCSRFGALHLSKNGTVVFNGKEIEDLIEPAQEC